jgi:hypothetical protein
LRSSTTQLYVLHTANGSVRRLRRITIQALMPTGQLLRRHGAVRPLLVGVLHYNQRYLPTVSCPATFRALRINLLTMSWRCAMDYSYEVIFPDVQLLFEELRSLRDFYRQFLASYESVGAELRRRKQYDAKVREFVSQGSMCATASIPPAKQREWLLLCRRSKRQRRSLRRWSNKRPQSVARFVRSMHASCHPRFARRFRFDWQLGFLTEGVLTH